MTGLDEPQVTLMPDERPAPLFGPISCVLAVISMAAPTISVILPLTGTLVCGVIALSRKERWPGLAWIGASAGALLLFVLIVGSAPPRPVSEVQRNLHWQYFDDVNKVRGYTDHWASLDSPTEIALNPPYEGPNLVTMLVTHVGIDGVPPIVRFQALKGQIECDDTGHITLRFEGEGAETYFCHALPDHGSKTIELDPKLDDPTWWHEAPKAIDRLVHDLGSAKPLWVELNFYGDSPQRVKFDTSGFDPKQAS